ncbi:MAG TPA: AAA family ATPase, partial [Candidatus Thalassarchaeaceae archaeon]|nr:AAA family ATPase [Candidatus Thalassarchaeaceae archaeon]
LVRELFDLAREKAPSIIFIDEIDAIGSKRMDTSTSGDREVQRTLMQLLAELDGFESLENVKVIAATNRPELLDKALLRPGRFDRIIDVGLPDINGRKHILEIMTKDVTISPSVNLDNLAKKSEGFSGAELKALILESGMLAIDEKSKQITISHFESGLKKIHDNRSDPIFGDPSGLYG